MLKIHYNKVSCKSLGAINGLGTYNLIGIIHDGFVLLLVLKHFQEHAIFFVVKPKIRATSAKRSNGN